LRRSRTHRDGPRTHFFYASGEVGLQVQQLIARADHAVQARLFQTQLGHELFTVGIVQLGDIRFNGRANRYHHRTFSRGNFTHFVEVRVVLETVFVNVGDVHGWLQGQEAQVFDRRFVFFSQVFQRAQHARVFQLWQTFFQGSQFRFRVLVAAFRFLLHAVNGALAGVEVREGQLGVDDVDVVSRIYFVVNVD